MVIEPPINPPPPPPPDPTQEMDCSHFSMMWVTLRGIPQWAKSIFYRVRAKSTYKHFGAPKRPVKVEWQTQTFCNQTI